MRHAIKGARPGQRYWTETGWVDTHPVDGGARMSDGQRASLTASGYALEQVSDVPPDQNGDVAPDLEAQAAIAANAAAAAEAQAAATIPSKADLAPKVRGKAKQ